VTLGGKQKERLHAVLLQALTSRAELERMLPTANISFNASGGTIQLFMTGDGYPGWSNVGSSGEAHSNWIWGRSWTVTVFRNSGDTCYTLDRDFNSSC
jgi:hypothetical protein